MSVGVAIIRRALSRIKFWERRVSMHYPGFLGVIPAIGEINTDPVSVCHQVSITSHFDFPTFLKYHSQTSGFIGSPTVPRTLRESRVDLSRYSSPFAINALMAVGAV